MNRLVNWPKKMYQLLISLLFGSSFSNVLNLLVFSVFGYKMNTDCSSDKASNLKMSFWALRDCVHYFWTFQRCTNQYIYINNRKNDSVM